jgi:hypothetical protein
MNSAFVERGSLKKFSTAAKLLDCSYKAIHHRWTRGEIPRHLVHRWGRTLLLDFDGFLTWLKSQGGGGTT